jgi:CRP-like cAMP-binding protein
MNPDDQARDPDQAGAQPGLPPAAANSEAAGPGGTSAVPAAGTPQQPGHGKGPDRGFWGLLSLAERATLLDLGQLSVFQDGATICAEGEEATDVFVLTEGWVKVLSVIRDRRGMVLALRGQGDFVGELAGDSGGCRTATVVAISPVRALAVTHDRFSLFLDSNLEANRAYRNVLTQRWLEATVMLRSRSLNNGAQRLASLLLDLAAQHGTPAGPGTAIGIPLSQDEIADLAGTSRATVTRALGDWRRLGLIDTARHQITINSTPGLRSAAGRDPSSRARQLALPEAFPPPPCSARAACSRSVPVHRNRTQPRIVITLCVLGAAGTRPAEPLRALATVVGCDLSVARTSPLR